jgi:flavin reductase (DIM6/NTAB) family NADH-FMN oxidoreductase RutF
VNRRLVFTKHANQDAKKLAQSGLKPQAERSSAFSGKTPATRRHLTRSSSEIFPAHVRVGSIYNIDWSTKSWITSRRLRSFPSGGEFIMEKIKIDNNVFVYPMPMVLAGSVVNNKANFMAVGWVSRVNFNPPMIGIALGPHYTNKGIEEQKAFSVNIPGISMIDKTDYCGLVSGSKTDKSLVFDVFYGDLKGAPLINECPVCMACKLYETVRLPSNTLFIGEIVEVYSEDCYLSDGKPDIQKINPFTLTMPDNNYWGVGNHAGKAWHIGKGLKVKDKKK